MSVYSPLSEPTDVGESQIDRETDRFIDVHNLSDVLGSYIQVEAHAGVVKSHAAQALTKGNVSLALAGPAKLSISAST